MTAATPHRLALVAAALLCGGAFAAGPPRPVRIQLHTGGDSALTADLSFLQKPHSGEALCRAVRRELDEQARA